jgi:hypothetical protein
VRPGGSYVVTDHRAGATSRPAIAGPAPGRVIWQQPLPRRGVFRAALAIDSAAAVRFRVGVSDDRTYEQLAAATVAARDGWTDLTVDLSAYAGWKWSLFYRPDRIRWRVVLSADAVSGVPGRAVWGAPSIVTDADSAREYLARRARLN